MKCLVGLLYYLILTNLAIEISYLFHLEGLTIRSRNDDIDNGQCGTTERYRLITNFERIMNKTETVENTPQKVKIQK